jgi:hypothetical protein
VKVRKSVWVLLEKQQGRAVHVLGAERTRQQARLAAKDYYLYERVSPGSVVIRRFLLESKAQRSLRRALKAFKKVKPVAPTLSPAEACDMVRRLRLNNLYGKQPMDGVREYDLRSAYPFALSTPKAGPKA